MRSTSFKPKFAARKRVRLAPQERPSLILDQTAEIFRAKGSVDCLWIASDAKRGSANRWFTISFPL